MCMERTLDEAWENLVPGYPAWEKKGLAREERRVAFRKGTAEREKFENMLPPHPTNDVSQIRL